jgi:ATP-binding cassette subfamily B protein
MKRTRRYSDLELLERLLKQARPYHLHIAALAVLSLVAAPLALLTPLPLKIAVDSILDSKPPPGLLEPLFGVLGGREGALLITAILVVLIALLNQAQAFCYALLSAYTGERLVLDFRSALFHHAQQLSLSYHDSHGASRSSYHIQYDAPSVQYIAIDGIIPFLGSSVTLIGILSVTLRLDWQLALIALGISPLLFLVSRAHRRRLRSQSARVKDLESSSLSLVQEVIGALRVVRAFNQEQREQTRFEGHSRDGMRARIRLAMTTGSFEIFSNLVAASGTGAVLFTGMYHVLSGQLSLGNLLLVMGYLVQLYTPLQTLSRKAASLQSHFASAERAFALLDQQPDVRERQRARPLVRAAGAVSFRHVTFGYEDDRVVLRDVSFDIDPGARVGISGATGAGKTTLISLLTRFFDPTDGAILLDGVDLRDYRLADLRRQFAIVLQDPVLFSTTIAENITYARPNATEQELIRAAKAANIHAFICDLPDGYATRVGERGMRLSGGERQRISLARAFLRDAPILIMDEPTSSVDVRTERSIMDAMEELMRGRTSLIIAHRQNTLRDCNVRLEIERGRIASGMLAGPPTLDELALDATRPSSLGTVERSPAAWT